MATVRKVGAIVLIAGSALLAIYWLYLIYSYDGSMPRAPQPHDGRVYPLNTHGSIVYLTKSQHYWLTFVGGLGSSLRHRRRDTKHKAKGSRIAMGTPNPPFNRSAKRRRRWVPVALCAPAPG